jgi:hypothetical protein
MEIRKILGGSFILLSMFLALTNIVFFKMTGGIIGVDIKSSFLTIITFVFFFVGLLFLSRVGKGLAALVVGGTLIGGGAHLAHKNKKNIEEKAKIENQVAYNKEIKKYHDEKAYLDTINKKVAYHTEDGRFLRTYKWDSVLDTLEQKYAIEPGTLKGIMMHESKGDTLALNDNDEGSGGAFMIMPGIAKKYGLKVFENSRTTRADYDYGKKLRNFINRNKRNPNKITEVDERFNFKKAADAAAHYLRDEYDIHGSWDDALSVFNKGRPAFFYRSANTPYVKSVRNFQDEYNKRDNMKHEYTGQKFNNKPHNNKRRSR